MLKISLLLNGSFLPGESQVPPSFPDSPSFNIHHRLHSQSRFPIFAVRRRKWPLDSFSPADTPSVPPRIAFRGASENPLKEAMALKTKNGAITRDFFETQPGRHFIAFTPGAAIDDHHAVRRLLCIDEDGE
ncbi:hypothetical protein DSTSK_02150 [Desulforhabdus sp. TSK]|nr:hypothetical protein DSTSK_02150 [Desulforhabdus sp. TSK]